MLFFFLIVNTNHKNLKQQKCHYSKKILKVSWIEHVRNEEILMKWRNYKENDTQKEIAKISGIWGKKAWRIYYSYSEGKRSKQVTYLVSFCEWMANQVHRWMVNRQQAGSCEDPHSDRIWHMKKKNCKLKSKKCYVLTKQQN